MSSLKHERNIGIELLRIIAMAMIVVLHITGSIFSDSDIVGINLFSKDILNAFSMCSVNIYAMITGFFFVQSDYSKALEIRVNKLLMLWFQVLFYSIGIAVLFAALSEVNATIRFWWKYLTPVYHNNYWYITAFFGMFAISPLIRNIVSTVKLQYLCKILFFILLLYSVLPMILKNRNVFLLNHGYSALWLIVCTFIGGILRRIHDINILNYKKLAYIFGG